MGETGEKKSRVKVLAPASTVKVEWVDVYAAFVTVPALDPARGAFTPKRLYATPSTRALTDQIKSFPAQNCALLDPSDATEFPGIHAADLCQLLNFGVIGLRT